MRPPGRELLWLALPCVVAVAVLWPLRPYGLMVNDDGWYLHPTLRMLRGEVLYRDVWIFYAPLEYHLLALLYRLHEPSLLLARSMWVVLLVGGVAGTWAVARRLAGPAVACLPALVFALAPGQWSKAFYTLCTVLWLLALARALERGSPARFAWLGAAAGLTTLARHDLGAVQMGLTALAVGAWLLRPGAFSAAPASTRGLLARAAAASAGWAALVVPMLGWYTAQGALDDLWEATIVRGVAQRGGWYGPGLSSLFSLSDPLGVAEGRVAGALLLAPLLVYATGAVVLLRWVRRRGWRPELLLVAALWVYAVAGLANTYYQMRLLRLLETGVPLYLLATWLCVELAGRAEGRRRALGGAAAAALAATYLVAVLGLVPRFLPAEDYSGSLRMRAYESPVEVLGDTALVPFPQAQEMRLVRAFIDAEAEPGAPVFAAPLQSLYYVLLERPNPTRVEAVHFRADRVLTDVQKQVEMERLLASDARHAIVMDAWLSWHETPDRIRRTLLEEFHPVRRYGSVVVMERGSDPWERAFTRAYVALARAGPTPGLESRLAELARGRPEEPLPWLLLGAARARLGRTGPAVHALDRAAALDPRDPTPLVLAGRTLAAAGRPRPAARRLRSALARGDDPETRALLRNLEARIRPREGD